MTFFSRIHRWLPFPECKKRFENNDKGNNQINYDYLRDSLVEATPGRYCWRDTDCDPRKHRPRRPGRIKISVTNLPIQRSFRAFVAKNTQRQ
ncbi:hypothetical protein PUN28_000872 [Cardiocondyla obscurior]|uniref:Uncharacterized protein n=1 Tax=Cardiocondyla obscurior TaxID=286306 RepID=A0AAW2H1Y1_9HYME